VQFSPYSKASNPRSQRQDETLALPCTLTLFKGQLKQDDMAVEGWYVSRAQKLQLAGPLQSL